MYIPIRTFKNIYSLNVFSITEMLHTQYGAGRTTHYLCKHNTTCKRQVEDMLMQSFRQVVTDVYDKNYNDYFRNGEIFSFFYRMPEGTEDTAERKVIIVLIMVMMMILIMLTIVMTMLMMILIMLTMVIMVVLVVLMI